MSYYEDERPRRHRSTKERRTNDEYDDDPHYRGGGGTRDTDVSRRPRNDSFESIEEVQRDFPPSGYSKKTTPRTTRARSVGGHDRSRGGYDYDDDESYSSRRKSKRSDEKRRPRRRDSYSSDSTLSRSPPRRRKSVGETALEALGIGGAAAAGRGRDSSRSRRHRGRSSSSSSYSSRGGGRSRRGGGKPKGKEQIIQALKAAATAGATEAARSRNTPGGWGGEKGRRVLTAAVSAGGFDKLIQSDRNPDKHGTRNVVQSTLVGLLTNHVVNGGRENSRSRSRNRGRHDRGRARSESRSGLKQIASTGALAAAGKAIYDRVRSKSRGRRGSASSSDTYDSRGPSRHQDKKKKRSSSISAFASKGLGALGLGELTDKRDDRGKHRSSAYDDDDRHHRSSRNGGPPPYAGGGYEDPRDVGQPRSNGGNGAMVYGDPNSYAHNPSHQHADHSDTSSDSDYGSSADDERTVRKARLSQVVTAGLASVATIHAAHNVYTSMEQRDKRHEAVADGDITAEQAKRARNKARMKDVAAISIAALGIKGAVSEWKEMKEKGQEAAEVKEKAKKHKEKRETRRQRMLDMGVDERQAGSAPTLPTYERYTVAPPPQPGPVYHNGNPYETGRAPSVPVAGYPGYAPSPPPQQQQYQQHIDTAVPHMHQAPASASAAFPPTQPHYPQPGF